jgi:hypothetical protein
MLPVEGLLMKRLVALTVMAAALSVGAATAAGAAPPAGAGQGGKPSGVACQQAGIKTLQSLGLLPAVAKNGIEVVGVGVVPFPQVLALHRSTPSLFQTGGVSVVVPGVGIVPATWCNGA